MSCAVDLGDQNFKMPPANKKASKNREKTGHNDSQSQEDEPDLEVLSRELEKRSKRATRSNDQSEKATNEGPSTSRALSAPESLPQDLIQEMRCEIAIMKKQAQD